MRPPLRHPTPGRRQMLQAGGISLLGLGLSHLEGLRAAAPARKNGRRSALFIFLSGGLGQHDSFDMKPDEFAQYIQKETQIWGKIISDAKLKLD